MERQTNTSRLASDIIRGRWLLADSEAYLPVAFALLSRASVHLESECAKPSFLLADGTEMDAGAEAPEPTVQKMVALAPLRGTMTKYKSCEGPGTVEIADFIVVCAQREDIAAIVLDIDSGGGAANAVPPMVEAIAAAKAAGKPVIAHCDLCCSAALWVASQCDLIYLDNGMSEIGSVGAVCTLSIPPEVDPQTGVKIVPVYARESEDKNKSYRKAVEGDYTLIQDELSPIVSQFREAVKAGRPNLDTEAEGILSGKTYLCDDALKVGLADARKTLTETVEAAFALAEVNQ